MSNKIIKDNKILPLYFDSQYQAIDFNTIY